MYFGLLVSQYFYNTFLFDPKSEWKIQNEEYTLWQLQQFWLHAQLQGRGMMGIAVHFHPGVRRSCKLVIEKEVSVCEWKLPLIFPLQIISEIKRVIRKKKPQKDLLLSESRTQGLCCTCWSCSNLLVYFRCSGGIFNNCLETKGSA